MNRRLIVASGICLMLAACATVPKDRGSGQINDLLKARSTIAAEAGFNANADIAELLTQPLDADAAVRVALNRNSHMQSLYAQLGVAQAEVYDASRLSNPTLGFLRLTADEGARTTWTLTQSFTELLFIGYRTRVGRSQVLQAQQQVAQSVLDLEAQVRGAYYQYVAAALVARLHEQGGLAARVSADYAKSLFDAGNISELQLSREQAAASRAYIELQSALTDSQQKQVELLTLMGLSLKQAPEFVERLDVPALQTLEPASLQSWAQQQRVDLAMLREQVTLYGSMQAHARRWFWLSDPQLQLEQERETDGTRLRGVGGSVGIPLFNQGKGTRLRARVQLEATQAALSALQLSINNGVVVQVDSLQRARQVVEEYRQRLVPLQERVVELSQQQHNYMLIGAFELLSARREVLQTYQEYLGATREYWLQYVALAKTVGGRLPDAVNDAAVGVSVGVDALPAAVESEETSHVDDGEHAGHSHADMKSGDAP